MGARCLSSAYTPLLHCFRGCGVKAEARDYMVRGVPFPMLACGVRPITMHWVSWPIRADCACRKHRHNKYLDASLAARPHVNGAAILERATLHKSHIGTDENIPDSSAAWASTNRQQ